MSKNLLTIILFSVVIFLSVYSVWRISQPRVLSAEEMKVNGYYGYGSFQELRDFNLVDHNGTVFTKENLNVKKTAPKTSRIRTIGILISSEKFIGYKQYLPTHQQLA